MPAPTRIGIAVVCCQGHYVVGIRDASQSLAGYAEFPGGKCHADEASDACAVRECREETGLDVLPAELISTINWSYDHGDVVLHFWLCHPVGSPAALPRCGVPFQWVSAAALRELRFPEANRSVVDYLIRTDEQDPD